MKSGTKQHTRQPRKPYTKPDVEQVRLRPDEAVLGGCKLSDWSGQLQALCTVPSDCSIIGVS